jgi:hypothetical protein
MPLPGARLTLKLQAFLVWVRTEAQLTAKALAA